MIVIYQTGPDGREGSSAYHQNEVTIGTGGACDHLLTSKNVGERHARIVLRDGKLIIVDLKSEAGTFVNGKRLSSPQVLRSTDSIFIGDVVLRVYTEALSATGIESPAQNFAMGHVDVSPHRGDTLSAPDFPLPEGALFQSAPVTRVVVYEDRADVTRTFSCNLPTGGGTIVIEDVTPLAQESLSTVTCRGEGTPHVEDVRIRRTFVVDESKRAARINDVTQELTRRREVLHAAQTRFANADREHTKLQAWFLAYTTHVGHALGQGANVTTLTADLEAMSAAKNHALNEVIAAQSDVLTANDEVQELEAVSKNQGAEVTRLKADLVVKISGAVGPVEISASTLVPCGLWRPTHEAHLLDDEMVRFVTRASVWQKTGEPWNNVSLAFSTARPSRGATLPTLSADILTTREKTTEERRTIQVEHRLAAVPSKDRAGLAPGVDDGGQPQRYSSSTPVSIASDGRPHLVEVSSFEARAAFSRVALPEVSQSVIRRASLQNRSGGPILAGPVTLRTGREYIGVGDVTFAGPGESFDVSFGSDDRFVVEFARSRAVEEKLIVKDRKIFVTEATLRSTATTPEDVTVLLRWPKSELEQVEVIASLPHCPSGAPTLDAHGTAVFPVTLKPGESKKIQVGFYFKTTNDVQIPDPW